MNIKKQSTGRFSRLKNKISNWFDSRLTRHVVSGLVVIALNQVLIAQHVPAPMAAEISQAAGALIKGQQ